MMQIAKQQVASMLQKLPEDCSLEDVEAIAAYNSPFYASAVAQKILDAAQSLGRFPNVGPIVSEIGEPEFRERFL